MNRNQMRELWTKPLPEVGYLNAENVGKTNATLIETNERADVLSRKIDETNERVDVLSRKTDETNERVEVLSRKIDGLDNRLSRIEEDVKDIKKGQERQDRILEMLSVKSIETDSYIRDFKRLI